MSDNSNDLAFTIDNNIIEHFPLRAAAYQRLILDDQVGISKLVSNITRKQDETLHEFVKKNRKRAMMNKLDTDLDNIFKKRKEEIERIKNELILLYNNGEGTPVNNIKEVKKYYDMANSIGERLYMKIDLVSLNLTEKQRRALGGDDTQYVLIKEVDINNQQIVYKLEDNLPELDTESENDSENETQNDADFFANELRLMKPPLYLEPAGVRVERVRGLPITLIGISANDATARNMYDKLPDVDDDDDDDEYMDALPLFLMKPPLDMDPAGAPMNTVLPPAWNNTSYILNYGMNPALTLDTIPQHQLNSIDYNISAIAQPYKAIAYYTQKQIAIPASEWYWHGKEQTFRVNLCRLQRTWSVSSSPYDKLALMRHAIMTYYVMADLSPLLEPFLIENVLEQKPMTNLFNDLNIQAQLQLENITSEAVQAADAKDDGFETKVEDGFETADNEDDDDEEGDDDENDDDSNWYAVNDLLMRPPLDMDPAGATLNKAGLDAIQENTRVAITRGTNILYYRVKEFYKQQGHVYGFIVVDKDNKEYYLYAKDKDNDGDAAMGYHMYLSEQRDTLALLHNLLDSSDNQKTTFYQEGEEVTVQIGPEKLQTFDAYVERIERINTKSFQNRDRQTGRLIRVDTTAQFLNEIGSSYATNFDTITLDADDILILKKELELIPLKKKNKNNNTKVFQVNKRSTILGQKFRPNATSKNKEGDNSLNILDKIVIKLEAQITRILKTDDIKEISRLMQISTQVRERANERITEILMKEIYVPYMQYVPEQDRTAFLKTYSVQLFGFMLSDDQIQYIPNQQSYNPYFQDLNEAVLEGTMHTEYLRLVLNNDNTNLDELEEDAIAALVDFYYEERVFLIASFKNNTVFPSAIKPGSLRKRPRDTSTLESDLENDYGSKKAKLILGWLKDKRIDLNIELPKIGVVTWNPALQQVRGARAVYNVKPSKPDGDCFYHSVYYACVGRLFAKYSIESCTEDTLTLLDDDNHVQRMRNDIMCAIHGANVPFDGRFTEFTMYEALARVARSDWADEAEIAIVAHIYNLNIRVWRSAGEGVIALVSEYGQGYQVNLYYRNYNNIGDPNHYDWLEPEPQAMNVDRDLPDIVLSMDPPGAALQTEAFIKAYLKKTDQLEDLKRLTNKTEDKLLEQIKKDVNKHIGAVPDADVKKYIERVVNNTLYVKGNSGLVPYLCDAYSEQAVLKFIDAMKLYLKFGHKMARSGEPQTFYSENYKEFFQQRSWKTGIRRYAEFRKYKYPINDRSLQVDERVRDSVLENREAINAEHDIITLESSSSFANWSSIVRFALYEKYNFFLPAVHETLQGGMQRKVKDAEVYDDKGIFQELMDREAFDDFVYVYCTLYTLIFNT